jgi:hypothetical protein
LCHKFRRIKIKIQKKDSVREVLVNKRVTNAYPSVHKQVSKSSKKRRNTAYQQKLVENTLQPTTIAFIKMDWRG